MNRTLAWLLGLEQATSIDEVDLSPAAPWAATNTFWLFFGAAALFALSLAFYLRRQPRRSLRLRVTLGLVRGSLLTLLLITLADPVLRVTLSSIHQPLLYLIFDGTESMALRDEYPAERLRSLENAVGLQSPSASQPPSRVELVQALLRRDSGNFFERLSMERDYRLQSFLFEGRSTSQLRRLDLNDNSDGPPSGVQLANQLTTTGQVTALGEMLNGAGQQFGSGGLAGVVVFSDFANNAGVAAVGARAGQQRSPAARLGVPLYAVGVGAIEAADLAVDLQVDPKMKRAERSSVLVKLRQQGLQDTSATVSVTARRLSGSGNGEGAEIPIGTRIVALTGPLQTADFSFTPEQAGRYEFRAEVQPLDEEIVTDNNRASREVQVIDDFLRLMYVANEPTWEWRFVKEVFHRDKLVGMDGFRTYLASSDPQVRESNVLFLPTLTPRRSDFFANDVVFLGDMPRNALNDRFCEMVREFVGRFGGGLVVIAGPRFGPRQLAGTAIEDLLPVIVDPDARIRDEQPFRLRQTIHAMRYPFMQLGDNDVDNVRGWENLRLLPWYQPVAAVREQASVLAEHPRDVCRDGKTPQPLIAVRPYGAGEVVYLGFNEMWRLRRLYGERYYRRFWSQLIYRLGMSHALGSEKRFVVRTDRAVYRADQKVTLIVEAYDENFEPLGRELGSDARLSAELLIPERDGGETVREFAVPLLRPGVFEAQLPVFAGGGYRIRVRDPVQGGFQEVMFDVTELSAERRSAIRNLRLQEQMADETGGGSYELTDVDQLVDDLDLQPLTEHTTRNFALWSTRFWFTLLVALMLGEWLVRKLVRMA